VSHNGARHPKEASAMKRFRSVLILTLSALAFATGVTGCKHPAPPGEQADNLTVGKVQGEIKVGMDAASVAQVLGSPNIVTTDEKRREVWIYDKVSSESVDTSNSVGGTIIIFGGQTSQLQRSKTQKTLTIIIKFDEDKKVRDFAYNYSQF
jgi:outer membrane protein assembly factor BamE (lipoprotein component of BamABCDE complex)